MLDLIAVALGALVFLALVIGYRAIARTLDRVQLDSDVAVTRRLNNSGRYIGRDEPLGE